MCMFDRFRQNFRIRTKVEQNAFSSEATGPLTGAVACACVTSTTESVAFKRTPLPLTLSLCAMALPRATPVSLSLPDIQMLSLDARVNSFRDWPSSLCPHAMAAAGFYAPTLAADCVKCFHCGSYFAYWIRDCDPLMEHLRLSPDCEFARVKARVASPAAPKKKQKTKPVDRNSNRVKAAAKRLFAEKK